MLKLSHDNYTQMELRTETGQDWDLSSNRHRESICCEFKATNNEAEYEALKIGLTTAKDMKIKNTKINRYSLLVINHVTGSYDAKDHKMMAYLEIVKDLQKEFDNFEFHLVPMEFNVEADALAGL